MLKEGKLPKRLKKSRERRRRSKRWPRRIASSNTKKNRRGYSRKVRGEKLRPRRELGRMSHLP